MRCSVGTKRLYAGSCPAARWWAGSARRRGARAARAATWRPSAPSSSRSRSPPRATRSTRSPSRSATTPSEPLPRTHTHTHTHTHRRSCAARFPTEPSRVEERVALKHGTRYRRPCFPPIPRSQGSSGTEENTSIGHRNVGDRVALSTFMTWIVITTLRFYSCFPSGRREHFGN